EHCGDRRCEQGGASACRQQGARCAGEAHRAGVPFDLRYGDAFLAAGPGPGTAGAGERLGRPRVGGCG
ncbi:hypothetical protein ABTL80_20350, partial [Acinetobacter baumannii]